MADNPPTGGRQAGDAPPDGGQPTRRAALQGFSRQRVGVSRKPEVPSVVVGQPKSAGIFVLRDAARRRSTRGIADWLRAALRLSLPELRFELTVSQRPVVDPFRDGGEGLRDFRLTAALGPVGPAPTDLIVIEAAAAEQPLLPSIGHHQSTVVKIRPARSSSAFAGMMAPALEGLLALSGTANGPDTVTTAEAGLITLTFTAHALAAAANIDPDQAMDASSTRLVDRLFESCVDAGVVAGRVELRVLAAWVDAWIGLATGDVERLEAARAALDAIANEPDLDLTERERAQIQCNLAIVGLALGNTNDGSRRLSEALAAARAARAMILAAVEPATTMDLHGLVGNIAAALGLRRSDRRLLVEADDALTAALGAGIRSQARGRWREAQQSVRAAINRQL